ncbi:hypothetical protein GCM10026983_34460 [Gracilibacillus alcaliphilus]
MGSDYGRKIDCQGYQLSNRIVKSASLSHISGIEAIHNKDRWDVILQRL